MAELERRYGSDAVRWFSTNTATVQADNLAADQLGGTIKAGKVALQLPRGNWRQVSHDIINTYSEKWSGHEGKITLGLSAYGFDVPARDVQKIGITIKKNLKKSGISLRLVPNTDPALSSATSHHNKLGLSPNKVELLIVYSESHGSIVAESTGAQNITALARRDQGRPRRDAFVGMLPPKLALLMVNLAAGVPLTASYSETSSTRVSPAAHFSEKDGGEETPTPRLLDPFCGTGVVLQEAALQGYAVYGTDLSEKMIRYSRDNLNWLEQSHRIKLDWYLHEGDAMTTTWQQPIDLVVSETYLGQPFSAFPSDEKLREVKANVDRIFTTFLMNIGPQLKPGTPLCLAIPAWHTPPSPEDAKRGHHGGIESLPFGPARDKENNPYAKFDDMLSDLGYLRPKYKNIPNNGLYYYRPDQIVARQLLLLVKK